MAAWLASDAGGVGRGSETDTLDGAPLLPALHLPVAEVFAP